jgi:protein arginine kinase
MRKDNELMLESPVWTNATGDYSDFVLSSKIKLTRNLQQFKFPDRATESEKTKIFNFIADRFQYPTFLLSKLSPLDRERLVERHIAGPGFLKNIEGKGLGLWDKESFSVIINDEDHIKIQHIISGLNLGLAYKEINKVDNFVADLLPYSFSSQFGYLTASPTNIGTALRASICLHLPGLVHSEKLRKVLDKLIHLGFAVRTGCGGGLKAEGNFFRISNLATLGRKEEEIIYSLEKTVLEVIEYEKEARNMLFKTAKLQVEDKIWRAYGILKNANLLSLEEFVNLLSAVRLGISMKILKDVDLKTINELLLYVKPAHIKKISGDTNSSTELDNYRAMYVRKVLNKHL